jgi:hypothetical protein
VYFSPADNHNPQPQKLTNPQFSYLCNTADNRDSSTPGGMQHQTHNHKSHHKRITHKKTIFIEEIVHTCTKQKDVVTFSDNLPLIYIHLISGLCHNSKINQKDTLNMNE